MAPGSKSPSGRDRASREARERARLYQARTDYHAGLQRRRVRDDWIAGVVAGVIIAGAIGSQVLYYTVGPAAAPEPSPTSSTSPSPAATESPTGEPVPGPTETP